MIFGSNTETRSCEPGIDNEPGTVRLSLLQVSQYRGKTRAMRHRADTYPTVSLSGGAVNAVRPGTADVSLEMLVLWS